MNLVPFKFKYLSLLHELLKSNDYLGISEVNMKTLPKIGYMALINDHPIAAGFLRRVEGGYAQLDTLTSNKLFGSQLRHEGINLVVNELIEESKRLKLHGIIALTKDEGVISRSKKLDFSELPEQRLIVKKLI